MYCQQWTLGKEKKKERKALGPLSQSKLLGDSPLIKALEYWLRKNKGKTIKLINAHGLCIIYDALLDIYITCILEIKL